MKKHWTRSGIMNAAGFALLISAAAVSVVVYLLRYDQLWLWYKVYQEKLLEAEQFIQSLGISWKFVLAMLIVFLVRTFIGLGYLRPYRRRSAVILGVDSELPRDYHYDEHQIFRGYEVRQRERVEDNQQE